MKENPPFEYKPATHRYFKFGTVEERGLSQYCDLAQSLGCEIISIIPGMIEIPGNIISGNGKPRMAPACSIYVRCLSEKWDIIMDEMERIAAQEVAGGKRAGIR